MKIVLVTNFTKNLKNNQYITIRGIIMSVMTRAIVLFLGVTIICIIIKLVFKTLDYTAFLSGAALMLACLAYMRES